MKLVYLFGENHFLIKEVEQIRTNVVDLFRIHEDAILLHEIYWEEISFYKKYNIQVFPLEKEQNENANDKLSKQLYDREMDMLETIQQAMLKHNVVIVVCGDTHIREEKNRGIRMSPIIRKLRKEKGIKLFIIRSSENEAK